MTARKAAGARDTARCTELAFFRTGRQLRHGGAKADMNAARQYVRLVEPAALGRRIFEDHLGIRVRAGVAQNQPSTAILTMRPRSSSIRCAIPIPIPEFHPGRAVAARRNPRAKETELERLNSAILLSINGIAASNAGDRVTNQTV